ncbi:hypothetical protein IAR55_000439 [Kwoniella newhampshirensis]|uniref:Uncharacterized protein n=1 Tax=Kwoniella newhampshirensis TaxID=1651941 RepID=A0AAW0Z6M8_9TREE
MNTPKNSSQDTFPSRGFSSRRRTQASAQSLDPEAVKARQAYHALLSDSAAESVYQASTQHVFHRDWVKQQSVQGEPTFARLIDEASGRVQSTSGTDQVRAATGGDTWSPNASGSQSHGT